MHNHINCVYYIIYIYFFTIEVISGVVNLQQNMFTISEKNPSSLVAYNSQKLLYVFIS